MKKLLLINGPNANLFGTREVATYGSTTFEQINQICVAKANALGFELETFQSNCEGEIVSKIQSATDKSVVGIVINPTAYAHTSIAIRDAISAVKTPTVEVHISNVFAREEFRHHSYVSAVALGVISGLGVKGYELAIEALVDSLK